jgi:hypothetical protein
MNVNYQVRSKILQDPMLKQLDVFHIHIFYDSQTCLNIILRRIPKSCVLKDPHLLGCYRHVD